MVREPGTVVAIESDCLWIETLQKSTCGGCAARQGCGQHLIGRLTGQTNRIRVLLNGRSATDFKAGDQVVVGIPEDILVKGAALVYLLPVIGLMAGAWFGQNFYHSDWLAIILGVTGLAGGGALVRLYSWRTRNDSRYCPVLMDEPNAES